MGSEPNYCESIVQAQLDAYNAHDLDAFIATYSEDVQIIEFPGTVLLQGSSALRQRYAAVFADDSVRAETVKRIVLGNVVIDHERATRAGADSVNEMQVIAIYEITAMKIAKVTFLAPE